MTGIVRTGYAWFSTSWGRPSWHPWLHVQGRRRSCPGERQLQRLVGKRASHARMLSLVGCIISQSCTPARTTCHSQYQAPWTTRCALSVPSFFLHEDKAGAVYILTGGCVGGRHYISRSELLFVSMASFHCLFRGEPNVTRQMTGNLMTGSPPPRTLCIQHCRWLDINISVQGELFCCCGHNPHTLPRVGPVIML